MRRYCSSKRVLKKVRGALSKILKREVGEECGRALERPTVIRGRLALDGEALLTERRS
jgi:hypothetical protein